MKLENVDNFDQKNSKTYFKLKIEIYVQLLELPFQHFLLNL